MNPILPIVLGIAAPGVWRCDRLPEEAVELVRDRNWCPLEIDVDRIEGKDDLLRIIAEAGRFPDHFGANWDAVADCLGDLSWLGCRGYVFIVRHGHRLSACCQANTEILLDVLAEAAETWSERGTVFTTVWEGDQPLELPSLDEL